MPKYCQEDIVLFDSLLVLLPSVAMTLMTVDLCVLSLGGVLLVTIAFTYNNIHCSLWPVMLNYGGVWFHR